MSESILNQNIVPNCDILSAGFRSTGWKIRSSVKR